MSQVYRPPGNGSRELAGDGVLTAASCRRGLVIRLGDHDKQWFSTALCGAMLFAFFPRR